MPKYFAFLRGINVGGHNIILMKDLAEMFVSLGFKNVKTFIQSGNVRFETKETDLALIKQKTEGLLREKIGAEIPVIIRTAEYLDTLVKSDPFNGIIADDNAKLYVCFLEKKPMRIPEFPVNDIKDGLYNISIGDNEAFIVSYKIDGHFGFPNNFMEKQLGVASTARNWNTILKMATDKT